MILELDVLHNISLCHTSDYSVDIHAEKCQSVRGWPRKVYFSPQLQIISDATTNKTCNRLAYWT